jgi:hypothetical protein
MADIIVSGVPVWEGDSSVRYTKWSLIYKSLNLLLSVLILIVFQQIMMKLIKKFYIIV